MSTRASKRQKTDPSPAKPHQTLFHFFSKPFLGASSKNEPLAPKSDSDSGSVNDESTRKSDISDVGNVVVKQLMAPPRMLNDEHPTEMNSMEFEASFTEPVDNCSPPPNNDEIIDPFDQVDFRDDEVKDEEFCDDETEFPTEGVDEIEDGLEVKPDVNGESQDSSVDDGPSCPFCNFSFRGLTENLITLHANRCLDNIPQSPPRKKIPWRPRKPQLQPEGTTPTSSAFAKIMANNTEDKAWKTAAITEQLRGIRAAVRPCPFYKIMPEMPGFAVDAFRYGKVEGIRGYFLSHFHSDHYGGLTANWTHGPIYCSRVTGALILQQIKVDPEFVVMLPIDQTVQIEGIDVTLIEANHCPGSVLFLFEKKMGKKTFRILHCGDFRASPVHIMHPTLRGKYLDAVYLDTTYLNPKYAFPAQEDVIAACALKCQLLSNGDISQVEGALSSIAGWVKKETSQDQEKGRLLVVVGTYSIGKERIVMGIARALGCKIYAPAYKRRICACLEDAELMELLTDNPKEGQVHMTSLGEIRAETLQQYLDEHKPAFSRVVGFRPTGWTYTPPNSRFTDSPTVHMIINHWRTPFSHQQLKAQRGSSTTAICFGAPYSEHSSFRDLTCFCCSLDIGRIVPTVNVHTAESREKMRGWVDKWSAFKKKEGKLTLEEGQVRW